MSRVLVTGSRGFIGSRIVATLNASNATTVPFVGDLRTLGFDRLPGQAPRDIDTVIHAAALITHRGDVSPDDYWAVNVEGTRRLLAAYGTQMIVFVSTTDVCRKELSTYAQSKREAEALVKERDDFCIVRLPSVFGPRQPQTSKLIPKLLRHFMLGEPRFDVRDDVRTYCHVDEAAAAVVRAIRLRGVVDSPKIQVSNAELVSLVRMLSEGAPWSSVPPEHRTLYEQLADCAAALTTETPLMTKVAR